MLAAVGLLFASLVLGLGTNYAHALGDKEGGICGYNELVRDAILANNKHKSYECNSDAYKGAKSSWGGTTSTTAGADFGAPTDTGGTAVADKQDEAKDLDLSAASAPFKPGKGELDGFVRGSRVDLTGTDLTVADIDLSDAVKSFAAADGTAVAYSKLGWAVGRGDGTAASVSDAIADPPVRNNNAPDAIGVTFLLDGGSKSSNGLTHTTFEGTEGEIVWITFGYGSPPKALTGINDNDGGVWLRVDFTVDGVATEKVSAMISTADDPNTIYAVPYRIKDDAENNFGRTDKRSIDISLGGSGTFAEALAGTNADGGDTDTDPDFNTEKFEDSIPRAARDADLMVIDEDDPPVSVNDRQDAVADPIATRVNLSRKRVGIDQLAGNDVGGATDAASHGLLLTLAVGRAAAGADDSDKIDSISVGDLSGLKGLMAAIPAAALDLSGNALTELPSGLFADVGADEKGDLTTLIDVTGNAGPTGDGFMLDNLGPVGDELIAGQVLKVDAPRKDGRIGFIDGSYEATEGGAWIFAVNIRDQDVAAGVTPMVQLKSLAGNSGKTDGNHPDINSASEFIDLSALEKGNYLIAIGLPENKDEDGDNTLTAIFGHGNATADPNVVTTVLDVASLTIRDKSYEAPVDMPDVPESSFETVIVSQNEYVEAPGNEDLKHNISNFTVTVGGEAVTANFLDVYNDTGGLDRWGYPTSEVVEIPGIGLTQFFQRGALHLESNAEVKRLLAWDYVGGDRGDNDQGVEPAPETAPEGGEQVGAFGHYVANVDADGNATGFLDFFNSLGGVAAFGFPKTEARADTGADGTLMEPGTTAGFTRQYFQAAVFQLAEDGSVQLTLLGDTLRGILVPGYADIDAFGAADALSVGDEVSPPVIDS
ncbi:MAG: hypothetical protein F4Y67_10140 [Chloroflexi bacterium]|nr:hypothetical protein [Chloroflexota bacterium]